MRRWFFYNALAIRDIVRLWSSTQHQVVIIAGICLPILLLMGLKRGHVAELRRELLTSPTGRQIVFWSAQGGALLDQTVLKQLRSIPDVELIIPESQRSVELQKNNSAAATASSGDNLVTLYATQPGDPILRQFGADVLKNGERAIVVTDTVAKSLGARANSDVTLVLRRRHQSVEESHTLQVRIRRVVPSTSQDNRSGYANVTFLTELETYVRGYASPKLGLPAIRGLTAADEYATYLLFCQRGPQTQLTTEDFAFFEDRGIQCTQVADDNVKSLYGILDAKRLSELVVYELKQRTPAGASQAFLRVSPMFLVENTRAVDDFALRWPAPVPVNVNGQSMTLIGLSLPKVHQTGGWIRDYMARPELGFDFEASTERPFSIQPFQGSLQAKDGEVTIAAKTKDKLRLTIVPAISSVQPPANGTQPPPSSGGQTASNGPPPPKTPSADSQLEAKPTEPSTTGDTAFDVLASALSSTRAGDNPAKKPPLTAAAIVPATFLAQFHAYEMGRAKYDPTSNGFVPNSEPIVFSKARLYTRTIDYVPAVASSLASIGYAVLSESTRISEIHQQDNSLQLLVIVVAGGVFFFGIVTVVSVLVDSTDRKRGTIGILRVMGMSRKGVFYVVVMRALVIGVLAALLSVVLGFAIGAMLSTDWTKHFPHFPANLRIAIAFQHLDVVGVFVGALLCAGFGAIVPAWRASSVDPFDAIMEGRFH